MDRTKPSIYVAVRPPGSQMNMRLDVSNVVETFEYVDSESKADTLKLTIKNDDLEAFDNPIWKKGNLLLVQWGYPGAMAPARECVIEKVTGFAKLSIEAHALSMLMNRATKCRTWENVTRSEVAAKIAGEWGYGADMQHIEATTQRFEVLSQGRVSDAAFLKRLANKQGFVFFLDFDGLHFHSRQMQQPTHRVLTYFTDPGRGDVKEIQIENDITAKPAAVLVQGRDPERKEPVNILAAIVEAAEAVVATQRIPVDLQGQPRSGLAPIPEIITAESAGNPALPATPVPPPPPRPPGAHHLETRQGEDGRLRDVWVDAYLNEISSSPPREPGIVARDVISAEPTSEVGEGARVEAQARQDRVQQTTVKMTMKIVGDPTMLAKTVVEVRGIGRRLSGPYYVTEVKHTIGDGYTCELKMRSDGTQGYQSPDFPEPAAREHCRQNNLWNLWGHTSALHEEQRLDAEGNRYSTWADDQGRAVGSETWIEGD